MRIDWETIICHGLIWLPLLLVLLMMWNQIPNTPMVYMEVK